MSSGIQAFNEGYVKTTWATGDVITAEKLNNMEDGIESALNRSNAHIFLYTDPESGTLYLTSVNPTVDTPTEDDYLTYNEIDKMVAEDNVVYVRQGEDFYVGGSIVLQKSSSIYEVIVESGAYIFYAETVDSVVSYTPD